MPYSAIVFDLDGTLLDTLGDLAGSCNAALERHGLPGHPVDAYRYFVGDGVANLIMRALPEGRRGDVKLAGEVAVTYRGEYEKRWRDSRPYEGIAEMLDELVRRGFVMAVLSNKPDDFTRKCVTELLPRWRFDLVMGAVPGVPHKPDPAGALKVAETLGRGPGEFLYLGDTATDMRTAVSAGMVPLGALWGFRTEEELRTSGARHILQRPTDLLPLIEKL